MSNGDFEIRGTGAIAAVCAAFIALVSALAYACEAQSEAQAKVGIECVKAGGEWTGTVCSRPGK